MVNINGIRRHVVAVVVWLNTKTTARVETSMNNIEYKCIFAGMQWKKIQRAPMDSKDHQILVQWTPWMEFMSSCEPTHTFIKNGGRIAASSAYIVVMKNHQCTRIIRGKCYYLNSSNEVCEVSD